MKIITEKENKLMLDWIFLNEYKFIPNPFGDNRKYLPLKNVNALDLFYDVKYRILKYEKIDTWEEENIIGDMITYNEENGFIHRHIDPTIPNKEHVRFNLFLSKPYSGGNPVYDDVVLDFNEREYLKYNVNRYYHSSLPVIGEKPRIAISYGILVDKLL